MIDSLPMYGSSEQVVGEPAATLDLHSKLFIATKVHNLIDVDTHLDTLAEWKHRALVQYIGITHYNSGGHDAVGRIRVQPRAFGGGDLIRRLSRRPVPAWAADAGCTNWPQLPLKFVVSHPAITCAIPATSTVAQLRENMQAGGGGLPDEGMRSRIAAEAAR